MTDCSKCGKPANPLFMCDRDTTNGQYCVTCFNQMPCLKQHPEDCVTTVHTTEAANDTSR